jgi:segregation and condensation protein B
MELKQILEAAMMAAARPLGLQEFANLFDEAERPTQEEMEQVLVEIQNDFEHRPLELKRVASGYRFQVRESFSPWVSRLFEERPGRYSRAFLETLAIIAYRQPATRGEIEDIRGVAVSSNIIKTMLERDWIQIVGHKDVPGRPALFATTRHFLDYFNLTSLSELPPLQEFIDALDVNASEAITDSVPQPLIAETHTEKNEIEHADSE